jgi:hypothetical protein
MKNTPVGHTQIEFMGTAVPDGDRCRGCQNISGGKCSTWGQDVSSDSVKCEWCKRACDQNGPIWKIKNERKIGKEK